jgi:hypothetical protein
VRRLDPRAAGENGTPGAFRASLGQGVGFEIITASSFAPLRVASEAGREAKSDQFGCRDTANLLARLEVTELDSPLEEIDELDTPPVGSVVAQEDVETGHQGAESAKKWLAETRAHLGYRLLTNPKDRVRIAQAFAAINKVVYGKAFDLIRVTEGPEIDFASLDAVSTAAKDGRVVLIEVKSTSKARGPHFRQHFFSLSTAELLVAQSLGPKLYRFAFVNRHTDECYEVSLEQVYARSRAIYPVWSVSLNDAEFPEGTRV